MKKILLFILCLTFISCYRKYNPNIHYGDKWYITPDGYVIREKAINRKIEREQKKIIRNLDSNEKLIFSNLQIEKH
jgi:hypothetical protein